jgi:multiple sugar transport system substrate-binding protein
MRRNLRALATLAVIPLALAACSSSSSSPGTVADSSTLVKGTTLTYWLWDTNQLGAYQKCADAFTAESGINVKVEQYGWDDYWSTLTNDFVAGTAPDVFTDHLSQYPTFADQKQILDIAPLVKKDNVDLSIYQPGLADLWVTADGKRYGLPKDWDTVGLFYNTDMATAAGLTADDMKNLAWNPTDGGTYEKAIAALTIDKNGVHGNQPGFDKTNVATYGLGLASSGAGFGQTEWSEYAMSNGFQYADKNPWGTKWNYDSKALADTMTWWRSLITKGYMPSLAVATSGVSLQETYGAGGSAMVTEGDWNTNAYMTLKGVKTAVAPTPVGPDGKRASVFNGLADSIYVGTKHPNESWAWVKFLGSAQCQDIVAGEAVVFPAVKSSLAKAEAAFTAKGYDMSAFTVHVTDGTTHLAPIAKHWPELDALMKAAGETFLSFKGGTEVYSEANKQVNALFANDK